MISNIGKYVESTKLVLIFLCYCNFPSICKKFFFPLVFFNYTTELQIRKQLEVNKAFGRVPLLESMKQLNTDSAATVKFEGPKT